MTPPGHYGSPPPPGSSDRSSRDIPQSVLQQLSGLPSARQEVPFNPVTGTLRGLDSHGELEDALAFSSQFGSEVGQAQELDVDHSFGPDEWVAQPHGQGQAQALDVAHAFGPGQVLGPAQGPVIQSEESSLAERRFEINEDGPPDKKSKRGGKHKKTHKKIQRKQKSKRKIKKYK